MKLMSNIIKIHKFDKEMDKPKLDTTGALVLTSTVRGQFPGSEIKIIPTGIAVEIPEGFYGLIMEHEDFSEKVKMAVKTKVITSQYREEIKLNVFNFTSYPEFIGKGQTLARLILMPIADVELKGVAQLRKTDTK